MLPRLAAALNQFLAPLISSTLRKKPAAGFVRARPALVSLPGGQQQQEEREPDSRDQNQVAAAHDEPVAQSSASTELVRFVGETQASRVALLGKIGTRVYSQAAQQVSRGSLKPGVMMDRKIE